MEERVATGRGGYLPEGDAEREPHDRRPQRHPCVTIGGREPHALTTGDGEGSEDDTSGHADCDPQGCMKGEASREPDPDESKRTDQSPTRDRKPEASGNHHPGDENKRGGGGKPNPEPYARSRQKQADQTRRQDARPDSRPATTWTRCRQRFRLPCRAGCARPIGRINTDTK